MIDVLVAGGGPAGLAAAIHCTLAGLSVTVAEPRVAPIDKACGEGLTPAAVRRLAALGVDPDGLPLRGIRYLDAGHRADALYRNGPGRGVRRTVLHSALAARAAELGIAVLPVRVPGFEQQADHVTAAGLEARYLVAADGLHSRLRRLAGNPPTAHARPDGGPPSEYLRPAGQQGPRRHGGPRPAPRRYGLRRHFRITPWTDLVEVYWTSGAEAYVTPVAPDEVGVALLFAAGSQGAGRRPSGSGESTAASRQAAGSGFAPAGRSGSAAAFAARLGAFPALVDRLAGAAPASEVRGAGPMRQDVPRRTANRVLLIGDASGYLDALTGEGIGVALAQADVLARCLAAGRHEDYERAWRRVSGPAWRLTAGLLWSRNQPLLARAIVPAAQRLPWLFTTLVNHAAQA